MYPKCFLVTCIIVLMACGDQSLSNITPELETIKTFPAADQRLWPYFAKFEDEGRVRGIPIDLTRANITGELIQISDEGVAGSCSYGGRQRTSEVTIDTKFWNRASVAYREYIVFHELGHCYLFRDHREDCKANGTWASLMRSGTLRICRDLYTVQTRTYYIDELFGIITD